MILNLLAGVFLGAGVFALLRLKKADQWHHLWFILLAFDVPPFVRVAALIVGIDDSLNHLVEWLGGPPEHSPLSLLYAAVYSLITKVFHKEK